MKCKIIAEQTLLASIIFDNTRLAEAREFIGPHDFSQELHRIIYEAMLMLYEDNEFIDFINLSEKLLSNGRTAALSYLKNFHAWPISKDISDLAEYIRRS
ncbi:MAG TPA: DnaB-like helicase N-terminal domain-containing protein [Dissulfurispiraceae bacterium]|nr:DnaB-like helicase N-terminal domain-containing protein [Dissulfurispiraceae bacterium]